MKLNEIIQSQPIKFVENTLGGQMWEKQKEIIIALNTHDIVSVRSCHSAGKSWISSRIALWFLFSHPMSVVWTTAPTGRQVYNILWREIRAAHAISQRPLGGEMLKTRFELSDKWFAYGFATKEGEAFQGLHSESSHILGICDEASGIKDVIFQAAEGTLSSQGAKLLMLGNPNSRTGYFADSFKQNRVYKVHISCFDTPNFKLNGIKNINDLKKCDIENLKILFPYLITPKFASSILEKYGEDSSNFKIRVLGEFPDAESDTMISIDDIEKAINDERQRYGEDEILGCDIARYGDDSTAIIYRKGNFAKILKKINGQNLMETTGAIVNFLREYPNSKAHIDIIGIGAGVYDRLREQSDVSMRVFGVNVAKPADDKEHFKNLRAEGWQTAKGWLKTGILEKNDEWYQLANPKYKVTSTGQVQLESKEDMKKRGIQSPDVADGLVLTLLPPTEGGFCEVILL